MILLAET